MDVRTRGQRRVPERVWPLGQDGPPGLQVLLRGLFAVESEVLVVRVDDRRARVETPECVQHDLGGLARHVGIAPLRADAVDRRLDDDGRVFAHVFSFVAIVYNRGELRGGNLWDGWMDRSR